MPVKEGQRYVDCTYCASRLEIVASEQATDAMPIPEAEALMLRDQLRELDDAWNKYFEQVSVPTSGGLRRAPDLAYVTGHVSIGLLVTIMASLLIALVSLWLVAVVALAGLIFTWVFVCAAEERREAFDLAQSRYYTRRDELLGKLGAPMGSVPH